MSDMNYWGAGFNPAPDCLIGTLSVAFLSFLMKIDGKLWKRTLLKTGISLNYA